MLKVSEAVLGEIVLERLIGTILRTAVEHAGAERGLLILPKGSELRIQATAITTGASVTIDLHDFPIHGADLPESLVLYTARTLENVIIADASASDAFGNDEYIRRKRARSVLCIPVIKQGELVALLYLENNLTDRVFTPARVAVLRFLTSQAATSLDNARLYRAVQEREARISRLVDLNIVGIFTFGSESEIIDANNSFLKIVGYDREDVAAGRLRWTELAAPECHELNLHKQHELLGVGSVQPFEEECIRKDGSRVPVLIGLAAFNEERDQPERGVAFVLDLSERKRAQDEAIDSERRFREAQMELAHANRVAVMGQLTASIAHEVSQPTNAILADAQAGLHWLEHQPPELDSARDALGHVVQNGMRAREVIERIRELIKKKPARRDRLDINSVISEVVELTKTDAARSGALVRTAFADGLAEVAGDRVELQQVTVNLILNGLEAMSDITDRPRELLIRTAIAASGDVFVGVTDSGPGLPPADPELLFKPFHSTKPGGLGIGLSICQSIIEAHGGRLWASPHRPHGAILQFTVPVWPEQGSSEEPMR
jgi:PAS domain S-box-containing protein